MSHALCAEFSRNEEERKEEIRKGILSFPISMPDQRMKASGSVPLCLREKNHHGT
jgi:hypothetical protein